MFKSLKIWILKRRLEKEADIAVAEIKRKWIYFIGTASFYESVPLSKRIDIFIKPITVFMEQSHPILMLRSDMFWGIFWTAIFESKSHPINDLRAAQKALIESYGSNSASTRD